MKIKLIVMLVAILALVCSCNLWEDNDSADNNFSLSFTVNDTLNNLVNGANVYLYYPFFENPESRETVIFSLTAFNEAFIDLRIYDVENHLINVVYADFVNKGRYSYVYKSFYHQ
jgi:hypothetical protein